MKKTNSNTKSRSKRKSGKKSAAYSKKRRPVQKTIHRITRLIKTIKRSRRYTLITIMGLLLVTGGTIAIISLAPWSHEPTIAVDDSRIGSDDEILKQYLTGYGPDKAIALIKTLPVDCHQRSHKVGRLSYELQGNKAFSVINSECMSGYTHGMTEAFFREHGTENLAEKLELICQGQQTGFYAHQCFHGIGHGLMAYNDYDLPAALKACDTLPPNKMNQESCYTGIFMENVVGAIAVDEAKTNPHHGDTFHTSSWLSSDPLFPCNAKEVEKKHKNSCYIFQTSRMIQVLANDYEKVAVACNSIELLYRPVCFSSMGRDLSNNYDTNYEQIEQACSRTSNFAHRLNCIEGASQDKFWHESEQDDALGMCKAMQWNQAKEKCYSTISSRGSEIIATHDGSQAFCDKYESEYKDLCEVKP